MRLETVLAALLFLAPVARAQDVPGQVLFESFGGLDDTNPPSELASPEAQDALNVESSLDGNAILKRSGFQRNFSLSITTSPVSGSFSFIDVNGNRQDIVCQDHNCAKSTNGSGFTVFLSTAGGACMPKRWQFVQINGKAYGANDCRDTILQYDGTTLLSPLTMPAGAVLELTKDRLVVSDVAANPNGVYYSQSGTYTNYTTGINSVDPYIDSIGSPGDRVSALKYTLGRLYIFKTTSITTCILGDQYNSKCFPVSNTIGTNDPLALVEVPGALYFRGNDRNYWRLDDSGLFLVSKRISKFVAAQTSGSVQNNTQTSQTDWQNGTQTPAASWNTSTTPGSIFPSSVTVYDNTTAAFSSGTLTNISTTDISGLSLTSATVQDNWSNNLVAGRLNWTATPNWAISSNRVFCTQNDLSSGRQIDEWISTSSVTISSGSWKFNHFWTSQGTSMCAGISQECFEFRFTETAGGNYYAVYLAEDDTNGPPEVNAVIGIKKVVGVSTVTFSQVQMGYAGNIDHSWNISRSTDGRISIQVDGVFISSTPADSSVGSPSGVKYLCSSQNSPTPVGGFRFHNELSSFYSYLYSPSGTAQSRIFDTAFSTPTWGPFGSTFTVQQNVEGQVNFYTQVSTSPNSDMWDAKVASSDTLRIASAQKRYIRYEADLVTFLSTKTPTVTGVSLAAATTGQFRTQCISPGSQISSWGLLSCAQTLAGSGSLVYYATSAVSCGALPATSPNAWTSVGNNATLGIGVSSSVYIGFASLLGSSTDQAQVDACTLYWNNGVLAPPVWGAYDSTKNGIYWTSAINNSSTNNRVLKYDLNLDQWYPFDLQANAIRQILGTIYFGDSTGGYWNSYGGVTSDNGAAINAYWKSKDVMGMSPFVDSNFNQISMVTKNQSAGNLTMTYTMANGATGNYSVSLSTGAAAVYVHANAKLPLMSPQQFMNVKFGNNSVVPFEVDALRIDYSSLPWKSANP